MEARPNSIDFPQKRFRDIDFSSLKEAIKGATDILWHNYTAVHVDRVIFEIAVGQNWTDLEQRFFLTKIFPKSWLSLLIRMKLLYEKIARSSAKSRSEVMLNYSCSCP